MLKESLKKQSLQDINKSLMASLNTFNLLTLIEKMNYKAPLLNKELHSMVLLDTPEKQIVLTIVDKGTEINSFQSNEQLILQVIWGKLRFHSHEESLNISSGELLTIQNKKPYILTTDEKTVFLLTLISGNMGQTKISFTGDKIK